MAILMRTSAGSWNVGNAQRVGSTRKRYWACSTRTLAGRQAGRGGVKKTNDKHICTLLQLERVLDSFLFHTPPFLPRLAARLPSPPSQLLLLSSRNRRSWRRHIDNCRSILYTLLTCQINTHVNMYVCVCEWGWGGVTDEAAYEQRQRTTWHGIKIMLNCL